MSGPQELSKPTRGHVESGTAAKIGGNVISSGQSKIGELASHALVGDQNVLRLEIPVVDSNRMAVLNSIQDLKESTFGPVIITNELALLSDV